MILTSHICLQGAGRVRNTYTEAPTQPRDTEALNGDAAWQHDLYEEGQPQARRVRPAASGFKMWALLLGLPLSFLQLEGASHNMLPAELAFFQ